LPAARPARRSQAQRSAQTRERVLEAAVRCLHEEGYAATTTLRVAELAGLSRGAMLHQFPTRVDMLLHVVSAVYEQELAAYAERLGAIPDPAERLKRLPQVVWAVLSRPAGVAVLEIMQGSRSDPVLAERLKPLQMRIETDSMRQAAQIAAALGQTSSPAMVRLIVWAIRGLSIAATLADDPAAIEDSVRLLGGLIAEASRRGGSDR